MLETSARLLRLLALLQTHRDWPGAELAQRLAVTTRTVRRDVDRLRELGYPVHAARGTAGYRLGSGAALPPLLLDDDEAVAVAVGLRTATAGSVSGIEETALRALTKLEQVLPSRLRHRVHTLQTATVRVGATGPPVSADTLMSIAGAIRCHETLRFDYTSPRGGASRRAVEPHRLVSWGRHWYLVAWDPDRNDWRTFRVDRIRSRTPNGPRFTPREPPGGDVVRYLSHQLTTQTWPYRAVVTLHEPAAAITERIWPGVGTVDPVDDTSCRLHIGADSPRDLVWMITSVDADFTIVNGPPELATALQAHAERCARAAEA
ncbi:MAG: YafY family transcriptional regulator [Pseudonocardia sp.]|nr:YafY family transcriptional regulator [Pseudonocardia sp.]